MWKRLVVGAMFLAATGAAGRPADDNWRLHGGAQIPISASVPTRTRFNERDRRRHSAWCGAEELGTTRGLEATPTRRGWGRLHDGRLERRVRLRRHERAETKWTYDPGVAKERAYFFCCDVVNRGVALDKGKVSRRHARRAPHCAGSTHRRPCVERSDDRPGQGVFDYQQRQGSREGQSRHRQRRRRV